MLFSLLNGMQLYVINESYDFSKVPESISKQKAFLNSVPSKLKMFFDIPYFYPDISLAIVNFPY